jgi:6-methylsalicylate decarboxylase
MQGQVQLGASRLTGCNCQLSRRGLLGGLGGVAALGLSSGAQGAAPAQGVIDVHAHFTPPQYIQDLAGTKLLQPPTLAWSVAKHIEEMDAAGVSRSILSVTTPGVTLGDAPANRRMARYTNDYAAKLVADHPGRLGQFTALPLTDVEGSLRELEYGLDQQKSQGVCVFTSYGQRWLGDKSFDPVFEELNRRRAVVYVHPSSPQCCGGLLPYLPDAMIEYGTDTTRAIAHYIYSGAAERYPEVRMIFSHAGGTMPYLIERFEIADRSFVKDRTRNGFKAAAAKFFYDTAQSANPATMGALQKVVPDSQIVFGTDYPFRSMREHVVRLQQSRTFDAEQLRALFRGNVAQHLPALLA